ASRSRNGDGGAHAMVAYGRMEGGEGGGRAAEREAREADARGVDLAGEAIVAAVGEQAVDQEADVAGLVDEVGPLRSADGDEAGERKVGCRHDVAVAGQVAGEIGAAEA